MDGTTTLHRELERAERDAGLRPGEPVTDATFTRRQLQVAAVLALMGAALIALAVVPNSVMPTPALRVLTLALAGVLVVYAVEQDRHLRRLTRLAADARQVSLAVADALSRCGVLEADDELLLLRDEFRDASEPIAAALADVLGAEQAWVRVPGPAGELPTRLSRRAVRRGAPLLVRADDGRTALAVPVWRDGLPIAVLEAVAHPGMRFTVADIALANACAAGAAAVARASL